MADNSSGLLPLDLSFFQFAGLSVSDFYNMDYAIPVYGYITPILAIIVTVTNTLFVIVFVKSKMNSPTHILLRFMAISDVLTVLIPSPCFVYMFVLENYEEFLPFRLCVVWDYFTSYLPAITHTASIWLTVILAVQRFLCVYFPLNVRMWFGVKKTYFFIILTYLFAIACNVCRFLEKKALPVTLRSKLDDTKMMEGCVDVPREWLINLGSEYMEIYSWARVILTQIVPCTALAVFNGTMLCKIKLAEKRRKTLRLNNELQNVRPTSQHDSREHRATTWLVIFIISSVMIVEIPIAIFFAIYAYMLTSQETIIPSDMIQPLEILLNVFVWVSYPLHFVMYSCMSTKFRKTLKAVLSPKCARRGHLFIEKKQPAVAPMVSVVTSNVTDTTRL